MKENLKGTSRQIKDNEYLVKKKAAKKKERNGTEEFGF